MTAAAQLALVQSAHSASTSSPKTQAAPGSRPSARVVALAPLGPLFAGVPVTSSYPVVLQDPEAQKQAAERNAIIQPILDFAADPRPFLHFQLTDGRQVNSQERAIELVLAEHHDLSRSTLMRWLRRYRTGGFAALTDRTRADKGQSRWFARNRKAALLAAYLYLGDVDERGNLRGSRQSVAFIHEQLRLQAASLGLELDDLPTYETVRVFLSQEISPAMKTLAREGRRAYRERMSPYLTRCYTDVYANQVWIGDHAIHDREVANDLFDDQPMGAPVRIRLSAMEDYRSRKIVGASWAWEGSSRAIAATMMRGILEFGPPELIYVDNGKDYKKIAKGARRGFEPATEAEIQPMERTGFLARAGIAVTHCIPRHPQSKAVERWFRTLHARYDSLGATYTSGSPFTRPEFTEAAMMRHRRLLKAGRVAESDYPLASTFILGCLSWIEEYNNTPHSGEGMDGQTPNEVFAANRNPDQKPIPEFTALALLMSEYERRQVRECAITLRNHRYTPRAEDRAAWAAMHEFNQREVLVAFDPNDLEFAVACELDGRAFAWLEAEAKLRFAPGDAETQRQIGESMEIRRGLEKATRLTVATIAGEARAHGARNGEEMLFSRLQLPQTAGSVITQRRPRLRADKGAVAPRTATEIAADILEDLK